MLHILCLFLLSLFPAESKVQISLYREAKTAVVVATVTLENAATVENDKVWKFKVQHLFQAPPNLKSLKLIEIPGRRFLPDDANKQYMVYADMDQGRLDVFHIMSCSKELKQYMEGLLKCSDSSALLRYVFDHLQSADKIVAEDAYVTFKEKTETELYAAKRLYDADRLRSWLQNMNIEAYKTCLYAQLLGYCGTADDVPLIELQLNRRIKDRISMTECLYAIIELKPQRGWELACQMIRPAKDDDTFQQKYAVLLALSQAKTIGRCLPPEKVEREILSEGLKHEDIADLFLEDIRRWKKWEYSSTILPLYKPEANNMTKRSIIRFALQTNDPRSKSFLDQARKDNAERVKDCEEILQLEKDSAKESSGK